MKKTIVLLGSLALSTSLFLGCGQDNTGGKEEVDSVTIGTVHENDGNEKSSDQLGLSVGKTGTVQDTLGEYEVTLESLKQTKNVKGMKLANDFFILAKVSIKNVGEEVLKASDTVQAVDLLDSDGAGGGNRSELAQGLNNFRDSKIAPGKTVEGWLVFDLWKSDHYKLAWNHNLSILSNKVTWKFNWNQLK